MKTRTAALVMTRKTALVNTRSKTMLMTSQPRHPAPGKGLQALGKDLVPDQATPLTEYKKWYNRNRPGKKERQEGAKARGIPLPPGVWPGSDAKGKSSKGKDKGKGKGKEKGKQDKGEQGKGKGQPGKVGGRPPPRKRPAAALVEPGNSQRPAEEQDYSYYSTEEEGPQPRPG